MKTLFQVAFLGLLVFSVSFPAVAKQDESLRYVTAAEVKQWEQKGENILYLDVREKDEFEAGHMDGARHIVWNEVEGLVDQLPKDRPIVTYCIHSAHRAPAAAQKLAKLGFDNAYVLEGGLVAWEAGGMTLRASDLSKTAAILEKSERCDVAAHQ